MKKLVLILGIVFVTMSSFTKSDNDISIAEENLSTKWCFSTWSFVYNATLGQGGSVDLALTLAGQAFDNCVDKKKK